MTEKNEGPRLLVMFEKATGGDRAQAIASEISLGGLFIETKTPMPNGTLLTIEISSGHDNVTLEGRVFSTRVTQEGPKLPPGMAVRFLDLPMAAVAKLTGMLERHRPPARTQIGTGAPPPPTPQGGVPALDVGAIPQAPVPSNLGAPAPTPNFKGTAIMGDPGAQADAMAQVAAAKQAAAAAAAPAPAAKPNFKGTAIMGDPGAQADAMAQVAAAKEAAAAAAAAPPKKLPFAGTMAMPEAPARPDLQFAPTPEAPPAFVPVPAPAAPMPAPPAPIPAPMPVPVGDPGMGYAPPVAPPAAPMAAFDQSAYATPAAPPYQAGPSPGIAPPQPWGQPAPMMGSPMMGAPAKSNTTMIIVIILVLFFVLSGGLGALFWAMG